VYVYVYVYVYVHVYLYVYVCVYVYVYVYVHVCVSACVCVCLYVCLCVCVYFAYICLLILPLTKYRMRFLDHRAILNPASPQDRNVPRNLKIHPDHLSDLLLRPLRILLASPVVISDPVKGQVVTPGLIKNMYVPVYINFCAIGFFSNDVTDEKSS